MKPFLLSAYLQKKPEENNGIENEEHHEGLLVVQNVIFDGRGNRVVEVEPGCKALGGVGVVVRVVEEEVHESQVDDHELDDHQEVVEVPFVELGLHEGVQHVVDFYFAVDQQNVRVDQSHFGLQGGN